MTNAGNYKLMICLSALSVAMTTATAKVDRNVEDKLKVAFTYNFTKFVDWPEEIMPDSDEPIIIGVIGPKSLFEAFEPIRNKKVKKRSILVKHLAGYEKLKKPAKDNHDRWTQSIETIKTCHVLICCDWHPTKMKHLAEILDAIKGSPVLTIGECAGFLEIGGIINFIKEKKKLRFEINLAAATDNDLTIASQLLRLAKRVL